MRKFEEKRILPAGKLSSHEATIIWFSYCQYFDLSYDYLNNMTNLSNDLIKYKKNHVLTVRQVVLDNVPLRNGLSSQNYGEEFMFLFFYSEK